MKAYECSTTSLRALLSNLSIPGDAVERTFGGLAGAYADARELGEAVRSGMDVAPAWRCRGVMRTRLTPSSLAPRSRRLLKQELGVFLIQPHKVGCVRAPAVGIHQIAIPPSQPGIAE